MSCRSQTAFCIFGILCGSIGLAQNYRCDWSVNGIGGGEMTGACKCGSTVGQTAAGQIAGTSYWALIGFWQTEGQTGVREQAYSPNQGPLVTRLYAPQPNPSRSHAAIRYSLAAEGRVTLRMYDLTGRVVRTLASGVMRRGRYAVEWDGNDDRGRALARGVYILKLQSDACSLTRKLVIE